MAKTSMLGAIRAAGAGVADDAAQETNNQPGAAAPPLKEGEMPNENNAAAGIPQGEHDAAVAAAEEKGRKAGADGEGARLGAVLSADGIKGDGKRMAAALDLAMKSPAMSVEDLTAFVTSNVAAAAEAAGPSRAEHEAGRMSGADLAGPAGAAPEKSGLSKNIDAVIARDKRS